MFRISNIKDTKRLDIYIDTSSQVGNEEKSIAKLEATHTHVRYYKKNIDIRLEDKGIRALTHEQYYNFIDLNTYYIIYKGDSCILKL